MNRKEDLNDIRYKEHYQKLLDAVRGKFFYIVMHEANKCIIYKKK